MGKGGVGQPACSVRVLRYTGLGVWLQAKVKNQSYCCNSMRTKQKFKDNCFIGSYSSESLISWLWSGHEKMVIIYSSDGHKHTVRLEYVGDSKPHAT